jgi:nucleotide-binding universal stress UspA family protein
MGPILVAYDGSESAKRALEAAARIANGHGVTVVSVAEVLPQVGRAGAMLVPEEHEERLHELSEAVDVLAKLGVKPHAVERRGDPAAAIVDEAEQEHADLIVLGTRGLGPTKRWLLGSVSTKVLHHAPCDVLVVK